MNSIINVDDVFMSLQIIRPNKVTFRHNNVPEAMPPIIGSWSSWKHEGNTQNTYDEIRAIESVYTMSENWNG